MTTTIPGLLTPTEFSEKVLVWYAQYGRKNLPWQRQDAYRVWLSEIMLQQTQVKTVIPYYYRFTERFPSIDALAQASLDEILSLWAGLGYYARARNCHRCAQWISKHYQGNFPQNLQQLCALPGIGRSTAGAILALAFNQRASILDGNVRRVLCRYAGIYGDITHSQTQQKLWALTEALTPMTNISEYTQAMMDLGATVCTRSQPNCQHCPLQQHCFAYQQQQIDCLPTRKNRRLLPEHHKKYLILRNDNQQILLVQRPPQGIWGGLWSLPEYEMDTDLVYHAHQQWGLHIQISNILPVLTHVFSHFRLHMTPVLAHLPEEFQPSLMDSKGHLWYNLAAPETIGIPKPVNTILRKL